MCINGYKGEEAFVTIPEKIGKNTVTRIGDSAFKDCTCITNIAISGSATVIGESAFDGCAGLTNITIPGSVTKIGDATFSGCTELIIRAPEGSYAEVYANHNSIDFAAK